MEVPMTKMFCHSILGVLACALLTVGVAVPVMAQYGDWGRVNAFQTVTRYVWAPAGQTRVVVDGDGDTDLDCWVYNRYGVLLAGDTDSTDLCIMNFRHETRGNLRIRVSNLGSVYNDYELTIQ
jgi:hypothetical protein